MKKAVLAGIIAAVLAWSFPVCAGAEEIDAGGSDEKTGKTVQSGEFTAQVLDDDTVIITGVDSSNEECDGIPEEIEGHPVSGIGKRAFEYKKFKELILPETVTVIEKDAFNYITVKNTLSLPENVRIEDEAFSYAELPKEITIPKGAYAGEEAFAYLYGTESLQIEDGAVIGKQCFSYAKHLKTVVIGEKAEISEQAFAYCDVLESVVAGSGTKLDENAFMECAALEGIDLPGDTETGEPDKADEPDKTEEPDKADKPDKTEEPDKADEPDKTDKPEESDKAGKAEQNTDTLADWNIRVTVPDDTETVLDESDDCYYIYLEDTGYIPYVMLTMYEGFDSVEEFIPAFTEYMQSEYTDLKVTAEPVKKTIGGKPCVEIDYGYNVSGYDIRDRRIAITVEGRTYMFVSKEVPELNEMVGTMLEDVIDGCVFLTDDGKEIPMFGGGGGDDRIAAEEDAA